MRWTRLLHPRGLCGSTRQPSQAMARRWQAEREALEACVATYGWSGTKQAVDKVHTQLAGWCGLGYLGW
jgi:hypothetical protein